MNYYDVISHPYFNRKSLDQTPFFIKALHIYAYITTILLLLVLLFCLCSSLVTLFCAISGFKATCDTNILRQLYPGHKYLTYSRASGYIVHQGVLVLRLLVFQTPFILNYIILNLTVFSLAQLSNCSYR